MAWLLSVLGIVLLTALPALGQAADEAEPSFDEPSFEEEETELVEGFDEEIPEDYDPWEPFNEKVFEFNYRFDKYLLKPAARAYDRVVLDGEQELIYNVYDHIAMPKRFVNSLLQGKFAGAGRELARFLINTALGGGGMADVARYQFGIEKSPEDTGQTLGLYGVGPGPYLILPFLSPLTVRDGVGYVIDTAMDPLFYVLPFVPAAGKKAEEIINDRARSLEAFENVEEATFDLYSAVRNAYLKRREKMIRE